ncbi:MAG: outer membrane beta-barrel protein [Bacteroidales bacterium]|nr:outer membrane beta-barrel protein [Bacteroidales bacterium]
MKKFTVLIAAIMLASVPAFSQVIPGAGYINSTFISGSTNSVQNGFYAGVSMDMKLSGLKGLSFVPGAYASLISSTSSGSFLGLVSGNGKSTEIDLSIPAYFKFTYGLSKDARVFAYAGPTAQIGVIAKSYSKTTSFLGSSESTRDLFSGSSGLNRFNVLIGGGVGFGFSQFSINVGYDYGLLNVYRGSSDTVMNRANLHVGVSFAL